MLSTKTSSVRLPEMHCVLLVVKNQKVSKSRSNEISRFSSCKSRLTPYRPKSAKKNSSTGR